MTAEKRTHIIIRRAETEALGERRRRSLLRGTEDPQEARTERRVIWGEASFHQECQDISLHTTRESGERTQVVILEPTHRNFQARLSLFSTGDRNINPALEKQTARAGARSTLAIESVQIAFHYSGDGVSEVQMVPGTAKHPAWAKWPRGDTESGDRVTLQNLFLG